MNIWIRGLKTKGTFALILLAFAILVVAGWVAYSAIQTLVTNESRVSQTKTILRTITDTFSAMQSVELGFRAFLITGKDEYLAPYRIAVENLETKLSSLNAIKSENEQQQARVSHLSDLILQRLEDIANVINNVDSLYEAKLALHQELIYDNEKLKAIRQLVREMEDTEYLLLHDQALAAKTAREKVFVSVTVAIIIAFSTLLATFLLFYRAIKKGEEEKHTLENLVEQRTSELKHLLNELQRSNQDLQDFAFVASHDLQEPLRKIRTFSDRLMMKYADELGDGKDYLVRMQSAAVRMSKLIDDLLEFSRVTTRAQPFEPIALNEVLAEVLETLEVSIEESKATISIAQLPTIEADASQLKQLFQNLIGNAIKFVPQDRNPVIEIDFNSITPVDHPLITDNTWYEITIKDNGIGFDEKYLDKIFTPFKRLHAKSKYAGTGIGLAVCKKIVDRHGGEITADSQPNMGTVFKIRLPATQISDSNLDLNPTHHSN